MILYLDSSAIVKQYVSEPGSVELSRTIAESEITGTSVIARAEVVAAFRKAVRTGALLESEAADLKRIFERGWPNLVRTRITERLAAFAATLGWSHGLRGYDSIHLASAIAWQEALMLRVTVATYDRALSSAAQALDVLVFPPQL